MNGLREAIAPPCPEAAQAARERQALLTKPPGSLGRLEQLAIQVSAWQGTDQPALERIAVRIFAADHGVVSEGVSAFPQSVTVQMLRNFASGGAAITVLARHLDADFRVVNMGCVEAADLPGVTRVAVAPGTHNFCIQPAMSEATLQAALDAAAAQVPGSAQLLVCGEMGIGNTTAAAALSAALLQRPARELVGRGTGVDADGLQRKVAVVERALALHDVDGRDPLALLRCLGGLEIAALVAAYIRAAQLGIPSLVDGYICTAAAAVACRLNPGLRDWLVFAHCSEEPGHRLLLAELQAQPLLDFGMRLGEGSGAAVAVPVLQAACRLQSEMATFAEAGVADGPAE